MEETEKIIQAPLTQSYVAKLEADAVARDRNPARQAAWILKRYYDGDLVWRDVTAGAVTSGREQAGEVVK